MAKVAVLPAEAAPAATARAEHMHQTIPVQRLVKEKQ